MEELYHKRLCITCFYVWLIYFIILNSQPCEMVPLCCHNFQKRKPAVVAGEFIRNFYKKSPCKIVKKRLFLIVHIMTFYWKVTPNLYQPTKKVLSSLYPNNIKYAHERMVALTLHWKWYRGELRWNSIFMSTKPTNWDLCRVWKCCIFYWLLYSINENNIDSKPYRYIPWSHWKTYESIFNSWKKGMIMFDILFRYLWKKQV